jgi:hypothetical protein
MPRRLRWWLPEKRKRRKCLLRADTACASQWAAGYRVETMEMIERWLGF